MAITPTVLSHDLTLTDGTTTLGLALARDKNGLPLLRVGYLPSLSDQQFTALSEAAFRPEYQAFVTQSDWLGGFGVQDFASRRYMQSLGVDASFPGILVPGPVAVSTTHTTPSYATTTTITNGGFETGDLSSWTVVQGTWAATTVEVRTGTYAARVEWSSGDEIKNTLTAADSSIFNTVAITVSAYMKAATGTASPGEGQIILKDADGTEIAAGTSTALSNSAWTEVTVAHTFTQGWPSLVVHFSFSAGSGTTYRYMDDVTVAMTGSIATATDMGTVTQLIDFNAAHYACSETGLWKRSANIWVRVAGSPDLIETMEKDDTYLYLCRGTSVNYWRMSTSEVFQRCTGTGTYSKVKRMEWVAESLWGAIAVQGVADYTNKLTGATNTAKSVGEPGYNITALVNHEESLYIATENGLFYIDSSGNVIEVVTRLRSMYDSNTGKNSFSWGGTGLYVPAESQELLEYNSDSGADTSVGPNRYAERLGDFGGQVVALGGDGEWLYAILDNSTKIEMLKGRRQAIGGETDWRWHPFFEDTYTTVTYAHVSTITAKRLYYGGGTAAVKYIPLPVNYADPLTDTNLTYLTAKTWESPWFDYGLALSDKTLASFLLHSTSLSGSARTVKVEYQKWGQSASTWTEVGGSSQGTYNTSPDQEKFFETGASAVKTKKIRFRLTLNTDDADTGLGVFGFSAYAVLNPPRLQQIAATVVVEDRGTLRMGGPDKDMTFQIVRDQLHSWAATHPLTLTLPDGTEDGLAYTVKFAEGFPVERYLDVGEVSGHPKRSPRSEFDLVFIAQRTS